jgi:hypothetical protein
MWQNKWVYQTTTNNSCPHINAELLLVSRMDYTMRILLYPLVWVVIINDAVLKHASSVKNTDEKRNALHVVKQNNDKTTE